MSHRRSVVCAMGPLFLVGLAAGCGGRTVLDTGGIISVDGGAVVDGGACIDLEVTAADITCASNDDCTETLTGEFCAGECPCGDTPVNRAAQAKFLAMDNAIGMAPCKCPAFGRPTCLHGECVLMDGGVISYADAGDIDAADSADALSSAGCPMFGGGVCPANTTCDVYFCPATAPTYATPCTCGSDGQWVGLCAASCPANVCVDIDLSTYDTSCAQASDCITILAGEVCSGSCDCFGPAVSASEQSRFDQAISGIEFADCPCVSPGPLKCLVGTCVLCGYKGASCPDAG